MTVAEVKSMSIEEKLQIMEAIWEDMRDHFEQASVPDETQSPFGSTAC
jgi:hypothetical protein